MARRHSTRMPDSPPTCDVHSARRIGADLERSYDGNLRIRFGEHKYSLRVNLRR
jgi:hypothetical protein